ncbi:hypothetical protein F4861DRAFT_158490 [Xylaria intraflava]|nr:hypothetical protein F4861DRAFT_158490 [Xylaria intraflava]
MEEICAKLRQTPKHLWMIPKAFSVPFLSDELMDDDRTPCSVTNFENPRLRKCRFDLATIDLKRSVGLGGGLDGYAWKVWIGEQAYVLKVFWDATPPYYPYYFAAQRESRNAALLQMMEAAVEDAASGSMRPILLNPHPTTRDEATSNTLAFSDEGRQSPVSGQSSDEVMSISSIPRMRKCYGWSKVHGRTINTWPRKMRPGVLRINKTKCYFSESEEYTAIVYEYVPEGDNDGAAVERAADFLWRAGFGYTLCSAARNWKSGVLVDLSDIVHVSGYGWNVKGYGPRSAESVLGP